MKMTLLEIVQDILNDLDSDEVSSIDDTVEAQQVAQIVKTCFFEMSSNRNWPHHKKLVQLESLSSTIKPNYLGLPDNVKELITFKYDRMDATGTDKKFEEITYKDPEAFLRYTNQRKSTDTNVVEIADFSGVQLLIVNDMAPQYWTTFDDKYIITDSYDAAVDTTLKGFKTQCIAYVTPSWSHTDSSYPDLPVEAFPALLEESKSTAFLALKQMANQKAEQKSGRQQRWLSRKAWRAAGGIKLPDYGRKKR